MDPSGHYAEPGDTDTPYDAADYNEDKKEADAAVAAEQAAGSSTVTSTTNAAKNNGTGATGEKQNEQVGPDGEPVNTLVAGGSSATSDQAGTKAIENINYESIKENRKVC